MGILVVVKLPPSGYFRASEAVLWRLVTAWLGMWWGRRGRSLRPAEASGSGAGVATWTVQPPGTQSTALPGSGTQISGSLGLSKDPIFFENKHFSWESRQKKSNTKRKLSILVYKLSGFSAASERGERWYFTLCPSFSSLLKASCMLASCRCVTVLGVNSALLELPPSSLLHGLSDPKKIKGYLQCILFERKSYFTGRGYVTLIPAILLPKMFGF